MKNCPTCGVAIEEKRPGGLCPACLMNQALVADTVRHDATVECARCRTLVGGQARFCDQCGAPVNAIAADEDVLRVALEARLRGQYRIIRLLGRGGMGAVYLARDLSLDREVAVKVVKTSSDSHDVHERFRREAKTAGRLSHPNIVPLHSFGEVEGMPYFVMGYVRGESLASRLQRDGRITEESGVRLIGEIASALEHAHRQGVVHRDVKPENVLIDDESGRAMLTDFGVAKAAGDGETMTAHGAVIGTPHYMSPEQAEGIAAVDGRSDIYSLGVMAYAVLSGRLPFEGKTAADVLTKHLTRQPPPLRSLNPAISPSTAQAIERCLAKDPARRWADAKALRLALGAGDDSHLPDALQAVEGRGIPGLALVVAWVTGFWLFGEKYGFWDDGGFIFFMLMSVCFPLMYLFLLFRIRHEGFSFGQSQAAIWREPSWWLWWYPRAWRRRGNVWDQLPGSVRKLRSLLPVLVFAVPLLLPIWILFLQDLVATDRPMEIVVISMIAAALFTWITESRRARKELAQKGVEAEEANRILYSAPPSRTSFWRRPHIAEALTLAERAGGSESPDSYLQSVLRYAEQLPLPLRPLGSEAAAAGRMLIAAIDDSDREIAELARSLDPGEEARVTAKVGALGDESAGMRMLLEQELELIRGISERIEEAKETRNRRLEMLRSLSVHLASLRAQSVETREAGSVTERVRALCEQIAVQSGHSSPTITT
jgi:hypothetical protein